MATKCEEPRGSVGISEAGVGQMMPLNFGGVKALLHVSDDISVATQSGMASGALTAAQLMARKPGAIGAPVMAAPVAPVAAPMAAPAMAPAAAPAAQIGGYRAAPGAEVSTRLLAKLAVHEVPFCVTVEASLAELQAGVVPTRNNFTIPSPDGIQHSTVVVRKLTITHAQSTARQAIGVRFGDLPTAMTQSLPGGKMGNSFHCKLPQMDQPPMCKAKNVFELTDMIDPNHLARYSKYHTREDLMKEVDKVEASGVYHIKIGSAIGYVMMRNHEKTSGAIVIELAGKKVIVAPIDVVEKIADAIYDGFIANKTYQNMLSHLHSFPVELVLLNVSNKWTDVPELSVEDEEVQQRELQRRFSVVVMGKMEVLAVSGDH